MSQPKQTREEVLANWQHDTQPGWEMYSSQDSEVSIVPCSLDVPLTQLEEPQSPTPTGESVLVPETPRKTRINRITREMEDDGYIVVMHEHSNGKIVHMMMKVYEKDSW